MGYELLIGAGIIAFLCVYMFFKLGENTGTEHVFYQVLILGLLIGSVVIIGGATLKESTCNILPINSTANELGTFYNYDEVCRDPTKTELTFFKLTQWFFRLSMAYIILYIIFRVMAAFGTDLIKYFKK